MEIKRCYDTIVGASVGENQLVQSGATSVTVQSGHKYYAKINGTESLGASTGSAITINDSAKDMVIDLSLYLPANIVDYIYSLETATAGSGIAKLREWGFLRGYQAYNAGSIESVKVTGKKVVGFNQWNEEWEVGDISASDGQNVANTSVIRSKNYIPVIPGATYFDYIGGQTSLALRTRFYDADKNYIGSAQKNGGAVIYNSTFVVPDNCYYMRFTPQSSYGTTYNHDICINLSSSRNGEYEAYVAQEYDYGDDVLNGIFKLDANNQLYADGDVKTADGVITRKYKKIVIDGNSDIRAGASGMSFAITISDKKRLSAWIDKPNGMADKLTGVTQASTWGVEYTFAFVTQSDGMYFKLSDSITTVEDAKTYLASNPITLVYELATPITEQGDPFTSPQVCYPDGTEEYVTSNGVPVGHETRYEL